MSLNQHNQFINQSYFKKTDTKGKYREEIVYKEKDITH